MKASIFIIRRCVLMLCALAFFAPNSIFAQTTAFTYQGRLTDGANAANGVYQMQFALFDAPSGNNQIGATITNASVQVTNGVFTVSLDFGATAFADGGSRFLEVTVGNTLLAPRQPVTSVPYASRALKAANAETATNATSLGNVAAAQYVLTSDARLSDARTPMAGSTNYIQNATSQQANTNFNISGNGTAGGTLAGNVVNAVTQYNLDGNRVLFSSANQDNTFVGINAGTSTSVGFNAFFGASAGKKNTSGYENSFFGASSAVENTSGSENAFFGRSAGLFNMTGSNNSFFGYNTGLSNTTGNNNTFFGWNAGNTNHTGSNNTIIGSNANVVGNNLDHATAIGADAAVSNSNTVVLGRAADDVRVPGNLIIPTLGSAGSTQLCRNASQEISTCSSSLRYKTNIAPFSFGLNLIKRLRPITFNWKDDGMHDLGLGAEDVAAIEPLLVTRNAAGTVEGVKYDRVAVVLVNAVKEQQEQIQRQQAQVQSLNALVIQQHQQLAQQQNMLKDLRRLVCTQHARTAVCHK